MRSLGPAAATLLAAALLTAPSSADAARRPHLPGIDPAKVTAVAACDATPAPGHAACAVDILASKADAQPLTSGGYGPADLQSAYGLPAPSGTPGSGPTVAVVDAYDDLSAESDLAVYRTRYGLGDCPASNGCFTKAGQTGSTTIFPSSPPSNDDWTVETSLDLDMVSAACPTCKIVLVEANSSSLPDLATAENTAANTFHAVVISNSYGGDEFHSEATSPIGQAYSHAGVAIVAASGDDGFAGGTSFPAALSTVTAVGGTSLTGSASTGWTETAWSGAGSGCSSFVAKPIWQTDSGCARRTIADVSAVGDPHTGLAVYDTALGNPGWMIVGGTSAATPIVAGYYAVVGGGAGVGGASWAYAHPAGFFDVASGTSGTCSLAYLCVAGFGYDGPTGLGTPDIATAATPRAPLAAIGTPSVNSDDVSLTGTVDPNGVATTCRFDYGPTTAYGSTAPCTFAGGQVTASGMAAVAVSGSLADVPPNPDPSSPYHVRVVALSSAGTTTGADATFTIAAPATPAAPPSPPSVDPTPPAPPASVSPPAPSPSPPATVAAVPTLRIALHAGQAKYTSGVSRTYSASGLTLSGTVRDQGGVPVAGVAVALSARIAGTVSFGKIATATTDASGRWSVAAPEGPSRRLRLSASKPGATSAAVVDVVETVSPELTARLRRASRSRATLSGTVTLAPLPLSGRVVIVQVLRGGTWRRVATVRPSADGRFSTRVALPRGRTLKVRAVVLATSQTAGARSPQASLVA